MGDNMNKKGFTLVELLGVFSITAIILLIVVPSVTNMLRKAKDDQYESFKNDIFLAAEAYVGVNHSDFLELKEEGGVAYISMQDLLYSDYLKSTIVDPKTNKKLAEEAYDYTIIVRTNSIKTFDFELVEQTYHPYNIGDFITYDPGDGIVRTWNVIKKSDQNESSLTIMLNENLGSSTTWSNISSALSSSTSKWDSNLYTNLHLITLDELNTLKQNNQIPNWMLQNLDDTVYGYWTTTAYTNASYAYVVSNNAEYVAISNSTNMGIRPIITIQKYK